MSKRPQDSQPSYEQAIEDLEAIIDRIESGQIGLEQCLAEYERGMKLVKRCQDILQTAQKKMAEVAVDIDGKLRQRQGGDPSEDQAPAADDDAPLDADVDADLDGDEPSDDATER